MGTKLCKRKLKSGRICLYLDHNYKGKRSYQFLNIYLDNDRVLNKEKLKKANEVKIQMENEIVCTDYNLPNHKNNRLNFVEYYNKITNEKPAGRSAWYNSYKKLNKFTKGNLRFFEIGDKWLEDYKTFLLKEVSPNTAHHYFANLRTALNTAVREKIIVSNPSLLVKGIPLKEVIIIYLTTEEINKLAETPCKNAQIKNAFLFSCYTGLRLSDVRNLTWGDIKDDQIHFRQQKTQIVQYLHLNETAKTILYHNYNSKIIPLPTLKVFKLPTTSPLLQTLKRWVKSAKIEKRVSFHTARRTFATQTYLHYNDIFMVSKLLGHQQVSTTQKYASVTDEKKKEAVNSIPPIKNLI